MSIYVSPGVYTKETDISNLIPSLSTTSAGIVGYSAKGDTTQLRLVTSKQQFIAQYGEPVLGNYFHYSALAYLENGNQLWCYRIQNGALYGGVKIKVSTSVSANAAISAGVSSPDFVEVSGEDNLFNIYGANPGAWNNRLSVIISDVSATDYTFKIKVYLLDDNSVNQLVETWTVSRKTQVDGYGRQQYLETMINGFSDYIVVADDVTQADDVLPKANATALTFTQGNDGSAVTDANYVTGWGRFENPDEVDIRILINANGYASDPVVTQTEMKRIVEARKDCIAILDVPYAYIGTTANTVAWRNSTQNFNSSYRALYSGWVKAYDAYNDSIIELPPSGYIASQMAYNDYNADIFYAPAGINRGQLNVLGVTPIYTQGERDLLYAAGVNPIQKFSGQGNVIWGQKTQQTKASATDRINVRRLLLVLEKSLAIALNGFTFEPNNENTRFRIVSMIEAFLDTYSAKGAFQTELGDKGYLVVCDTSNNTPAVIDANELHVDVFVKPSRAAEFIQLNTIITNSGVSFNELLAKGINI